MSEISVRAIDGKDDDLHNSDSTTIETTFLIKGEMSTIAGDEIIESCRESSKDKGGVERTNDHNVSANTLAASNTVTRDAVKEKSAIDFLESGNVAPRTPSSNGEAMAAGDTAHSGQARDENHNADSSDDESSYFRDSRNLPRSKSEERDSFSSSSNLSISEESVDDRRDRYCHPKTSSMHNDQDSAAPKPFSSPKITSTRSFDSLHSDSETDDDLSSDPSVRDELKRVADPVRRRPTAVPSGRKSPILGEHPPSRGNDMFFSSHSSIGLDPSPPTISSAYQHQRYLHPQAQNISQEQWATWMAAENAAYRQQLMSVNPYFSEDSARGNSLQTRSFQSNSSTVEYIEDSREGNGNEPIFQNYAGSSMQTMRKLPTKTGKKRSVGTSKVRSPRKKASESFREDEYVSAVVTSADGHQQMRLEHHIERIGNFKVYWKRWIMLMYMSILNLLSDWTCYSVAPIALLTNQAFGNINPELLVTVFLMANAVATACEPIILSRLGLRRTVLFGALLLMIGSIIKSGGMPPIIAADLQKGQGEWRVYAGFLLVGLSQPLYQCTPALLSASWFPDVERTMATGIALNANQLGIGFAFIFGTLLVADSDDIPPYFGLLSILSTVAFLGVLLQFEDAPPTPPSDSARVMKGTLEVNLPTVQSVFDSFRKIGTGRDEDPANSSAFQDTNRETNSKKQSPPSEGSPILRHGDTIEGARRRYLSKSESLDSQKESLFRVHASAPAMRDPVASLDDNFSPVYPAPSPSNDGPVTTMDERREDEDDELETPQQVPMNPYIMHPYVVYGGYFPYAIPNQRQSHGVSQNRPEILQAYSNLPDAHEDEHHSYPYNRFPPHQIAYWDQRYQQYAYYQLPPPFYGSMPSPQHPRPFLYNSGDDRANQYLPSSDVINEGAEPVLTVRPHHLDINIRDDQVLLSIKACMARKGFIHSLVSFTVSGVVINTLSTFMDYLVRLNGAGREYTGIVGGTFQFGIMISSLLVGKICDTTRAYYSITIFMLVLGAFGLAQCGVSLDAARGNDLRWALVVVALLVGPLQPISTELGVEVAYPLSENTVLVIQQLFSNLISAIFIPCFKAMKDLGLGQADAEISVAEKPAYTFSFYLLIVLHAAATVFFATFNGRYLRYDHEVEKANEAIRRARHTGAFQRGGSETQSEAGYPNETMPLISPQR